MLKGTKIARLYWAALILLIAGRSIVMGQVTPSASSSSEFGIFASFGAQKTHVIADNFNSLGVDGGIYLQRSRFVGLELKGDLFPFYARYEEAPFTGGYRFALYPSPRVLPGSEIFGYFGGGVAKAQSAGNHYETLSAQWSPCWQGSQGVNIPIHGHWMWKAYEASYTQTYTPARTLWSFTVTTGLTYSFGSAR